MRRGNELGNWWRPVIGAAAVAVLLGGCSSVPDAVNPVKWYEGTVDLFSGDEEEGQAAEAESAPGADEPFPSLGTVPERPEASSAEERERVAEGLVADRENRRYGSSIERQGAPANVLGSAPETPTPEPTSPSSVPALPTAPEPTAPSTSAMPDAPASEPVGSGRAEAAPRSMAAAPPPSPEVSMEAPALPESAPAAAPMPSTEVSPRETRPVAPPANAMTPSFDEDETVVISSDGVQSTRPVAADAASRFRPQQMTGAPTPSGALRVATIQFAIGSASLDARDRAILRQVVALQEERGGVIRVVGHASARTANMDPVQHKLVNYEVSEDRAQAVAEALVQLGAPADSVVSDAKADTDPVFYEFMPSGEAGNRRTEVYLEF